MTNEEIYDKEIAPALKKIADRCVELKFPFLASIEYDRGLEGGIGMTEYRPADRPSAQQLLVHYASRCNGNVDSLIMAIIRDAEKHGHTSAYLRILGVNERPDGGEIYEDSKTHDHL